MKIIYSDMQIPKKIKKSIFLAGPSPRDMNTYDWKKDAINILKKLNFNGTVFLPVPKKRFEGEPEVEGWSYDNQINWECECRNIADLNLFWVPRNINGKMPAFVTNIEFGEDLNNNKIIYGRPDIAEKCKYLDFRINSLNKKIYSDLEDLLRSCLILLGEGKERKNGDVYFPLLLWEDRKFQKWHKKFIQKYEILKAKTIFTTVKSHKLKHCIFEVTYLKNNKEKTKQISL